MSPITVECRRDDCPQSFTVEPTQDSARCTGCGTKHTPPWNTNPDAGVTTDSGATIEAPANATIRITIEVVPEGQQ